MARNLGRGSCPCVFHMHVHVRDVSSVLNSLLWRVCVHSIHLYCHVQILLYIMYMYMYMYMYMCIIHVPTAVRATIILLSSSSLEMGLVK